MFHGRVLSGMDGMGHFEIRGDWHFVLVAGLAPKIVPSCDVQCSDQTSYVTCVVV
jgi:hypothetical protein